LRHYVLPHHAFQWVKSHIWMSHVTHMDELCHTYECIMRHIQMSRGTHMNSACHAYGLSCIQVHSCHTWEWAMACIWMHRVTPTPDPKCIKVELDISRTNADSLCGQIRFYIGVCRCTVAFVLQGPTLCTDPNATVIYILIWRTYCTFVWENKMLALGVCFPQPCSSAGRTFPAYRSRLGYYQPIGSFLQERIRKNAL